MSKNKHQLKLFDDSDEALELTRRIFFRGGKQTPRNHVPPFEWAQPGWARQRGTRVAVWDGDREGFVSEHKGDRIVVCLDDGKQSPPDGYTAEFPASEVTILRPAWKRR